jgi:hypothetical protein
MAFAPLEGCRQVTATNRHTAVHYAHILKELSDIQFPDVKTIRLVRDNLNTHCKASLYEAFPPAEAGRLAERFEGYKTPKHASWLNMVESELRVVAAQCMSRRMPIRQR